MLDRTTESTVPQFAGLYGHPDLIAAFQQDLRDRHLSTTAREEDEGKGALTARQGS
ncbi:hypothetical protein [Nonomuraea sp. NPDC003214]